MLNLVVLLLVCGAVCKGTNLPSTFKKCSKSSKNFNECLSKAVGDAVQQLNVQRKDVGLPSLDPLKVPTLKIGAGSGAVQFDQNYRNFRVIGLTKNLSMKAEMDQEKKILKLDFSNPEVRLESNYEINGKILLLPISGKGPCTLILYQPNFIIMFFLEEHNKNGVQRYRVKKYDLKIEPQKIHFQLDNLFNGDKALGDNINNVLNDNWKAVYDDVKASYEDAFGMIFSKIFDNFLEKVSVEELFDA